MKIDAHNHADWHGRDYAAFVANMDAFGIDKCWILSWETPMDEVDPATIPAFSSVTGASYCPVSYANCLAYKRRDPARFVLGYAPDPRRPYALEKLKAEVNINHVQVCGEIKLRLLYDDPDAQQNAAAFPRPNWWYGGGIDNLEHLLQLCPRTDFLGHAPGFWCHISGDDRGLTEAYPDGPVLPGGRIEQLLDRYDNLYCDISAGSGCRALRRDPEYTRRLLLKHPDRFVYARDYFDNIHQELLDSLDLPADVSELIYHSNAERLTEKTR